MGTKLSIISPILDSHEIVRRQLLHYDAMNLSDKKAELIIVDDGSNPPITSERRNYLRIIYTNDTRPWTEHIARNRGASEAKAEYVLLIDIDYIIPEETIEACLSFTGDRMNFRRRFGILDDNGNLLYGDDTLKKWELKSKWIRRQYFPGHRSQFLIRKSLFWKLGGYNEALDGVWRRTGGAGEKFWRFWQRAEAAGKMVMHHERPTIFMFPSGKFCNGNESTNSELFHNLKRREEMASLNKLRRRNSNKAKRRNSNKAKRRMAKERIAKAEQK